MVARGLFVVMGCAVFGFEAHGDDVLDVVKAFNPYVLGGVTYESNLLLLPKSAESDTYVTFGGGLDAEFILGRQQISFDGRFYRNDFDRFSYLNHNGGEADLVWDWIAGRLWSGRVGYGFQQSLRSFAFQVLPFRDLISRNRVFVEADRWVADQWRVGLKGNWTGVAFSATGTQDRDLLGGELNIDFVTGRSNEIGLRASYANGDFKSEAIADYYELQVGPHASWRFSPKTRLDAFVGYLERNYDFGDDNDFNGPVARLSVLWKATGKTAIDLAVWRTVSALGDEIANYAVVQGVTITPVWEIGAKTSLRAVASYEEQDFKGTNIDPQSLEDRIDNVTDLELWLDWSPMRYLRLSLGSAREERTSTRPLREYDNQALFAQIEFGF